VPVRRVYAFFRDGVKVEIILKRYPQLGAAKVLDALAFALDNPEVIQADIDQERSLLARAGHKASRVRVSDRQMPLPFDTEEEE
jgi:hypothetical protein